MSVKGIIFSKARPKAKQTRPSYFKTKSPPSTSLLIIYPTTDQSQKKHPKSKSSNKAKTKAMIEEQQRRGAPYGVLLAVVVVVVVVMVVPLLLGDQGEALTEFIAELLSPVGLLLLPIVLLLVIQFLSSDQGSFVSSIFSTGEPDTIHRVSGSPVGVALFLVLVLFLLFNRVSIFGGDDDSGE